MLMPWIFSGSAVNQVAYAAPSPQTMPTVPCPNAAGKFSLSASNQYSLIAAACVVQMKMPASRMAVLPVACPHWIRALAKFMPSDEDSWLLPAKNEPWPEAQSWPA